eukprot:2261135-Pyramimonas_sp.AAC.1
MGRIWSLRSWRAPTASMGPLLPWRTLRPTQAVCQVSSLSASRRCASVGASTRSASATWAGPPQRPPASR